MVRQEVGDFVSPGEPTRHELASEKFQPGTGTGSFDHLADRIGFLAVATTRGFDPTAQTVIIESIVLALDSRKKDLVRHPPIMTPSSLGFAPDEFRDDTKSPMFYDLVRGLF